MFSDFESTKSDVAVDDFLSECAKHFFSLGADSAPTLHFSTKVGPISVFVFEENAATLGFFADILARDGARFRRMSEAFARAQPNLTKGGAGWAITRFAGAEHLSLQLGGEIYVRPVPKAISKLMVCRAKAEQRFLDCSVETAGGNAQGAMPLALAYTLAG